jgi:hypothetical protein
LLEFQPVGDLAEDEIPDLRMGFSTSNVKSGTSTSARHTHEFGPISKEWYRKRESEDLFYAMLLCACGATKEVVAEDRRTPAKTGEL